MTANNPARRPVSATDAGARVDVWLVRLDAPESSVSAATARLSPDEQARAGAFRNDTARQNFVLAHAALRSILAQQLQLASAAIQFTTGPHGKPALTGTAAGRLEFNLTHSGQLALIAVTARAEVGIDVEAIRPMPDALPLAKRFFSAHEAAELQEQPAREQSAAFLNLWTRKEALAKATGLGIANSLARFEVAMGAEANVRTIDGDAGLAAQWSLHSFQPAPGYVAAVAVRSPGARFGFHEFQSR